MAHTSQFVLYLHILLGESAFLIYTDLVLIITPTLKLWEWRQINFISSWHYNIYICFTFPVSISVLPFFLFIWELYHVSFLFNKFSASHRVSWDSFFIFSREQIVTRSSCTLLSLLDFTRYIPEYMTAVPLSPTRGRSSSINPHQGAFQKRKVHNLSLCILDHMDPVRAGVRPLC